MYGHRLKCTRGADSLPNNSGLELDERQVEWIMILAPIPKCEILSLSWGSVEPIINERGVRGVSRYATSLEIIHDV